MHILKKNTFTYVISLTPCGASAVLTFQKNNLDEDAVRMAIAEASWKKDLSTMTLSEYLDYVATYVCEQTGCTSSVANVDLGIGWACEATTPCLECSDASEGFKQFLREGPWLNDCGECEGCEGCDGTDCDQSEDWCDACNGCKGCAGNPEDKRMRNEIADSDCSTCSVCGSIAHHNEKDAFRAEFPISITFPESQTVHTLICRDPVNGVHKEEILGLVNHVVKIVEQKPIKCSKEKLVETIIGVLSAAGYNVDVYSGGIALEFTAVTEQK